MIGGDGRRRDRGIGRELRRRGRENGLVHIREQDAGILDEGCGSRADQGCNALGGRLPGGG